MVTVMMMSAEGLRQVLRARKLATLRSLRKIRCQLVELACARGVALRRIGLCSSLQVRGNLLRYLLVLGWVALL